MKRSEKFHAKNMKEDAKRYLEKEIKQLKMYRDDYPENAAIIRMKEDKIKGVADMAISLNLIPFDEYLELRKAILYSESV